MALDWAALSDIAYRLARRWTRSTEDARDVAQDALVQLIVGRATVREPIPWLVVATRRLAARRTRRQTELPIDLAHARTIHAIDNTPHAVLLDLMFGSSRQLTARDRTVLSMIRCGYTHKEVALALHCSRRDIGQYVSRALNRLCRPRRALSAKPTNATPSQ